MNTLQKVTNKQHETAALVVLGELHEKRGEMDEAVDAYQRVGKGVRGVTERISSIKNGQREKEKEREQAEARQRMQEQKAKDAAEAETKKQERAEKARKDQEAKGKFLGNKTPKKPTDTVGLKEKLDTPDKTGRKSGMKTSGKQLSVITPQQKALEEKQERQRREQEAKAKAQAEKDEKARQRELDRK